MSSDLKARILEATRAAPSVTRPATRKDGWLVASASVIVAVTMFFAFNGTDHGQGRASWFYVASCVGWLAVAAVSMWAALARGSSVAGRPRAWLLAVVAGTPALLFGMMFGLGVAYPEATLLHSERVGFKCLGLTVAAALFPLMGLAVVRRQSDPVHPIATGAALGAACGASAGVMVEMWCPVAAPRHVAVGHILPIFIMAVVGALLGARVIAMRDASRR